MGGPSTVAPIQRVEARAYEIPTDAPESDGTLEWDSTTIVIAEAHADGRTGLGYTYGHGVCAPLIRGKLGPLLEGMDALDVRACWEAQIASVRNLGRPGIASHGISAVDTALWDLKARLLEVPLVVLLDAVRDDAPVYGSGGFTSYETDRLADQFAAWVEDGIPAVKMKVGRHPTEDPDRARIAREAVGDEVELMVDANGAYSRKEALELAKSFASLGVVWFEEPVTSDDLDGLRLIRDRAPVPVEVTAGEYGYDPWYFERMLEADAVDVLQADATRCGGFTGFVEAASLSHGRNLELSAHTAPQLHAHAGCAAPAFRHIEYFHDHVRIERMLFDGVLEPANGSLIPDRSRPGHGLELRRPDAEPYAIDF